VRILQSSFQKKFPELLTPTKTSEKGKRVFVKKFGFFLRRLKKLSPHNRGSDERSVQRTKRKLKEKPR